MAAFEPTQVGDRYTLAMADCLEYLPTLRRGCADVFLMDPPYTATGSSTNGRSSGADTQFFLHWLRDVASQIQRVVKPTGSGFVFCDWRTAHIIDAAFSSPGSRMRAGAWSVSQLLVWDRMAIGMGSPFRNSYEMIAFVRGPEWKSELPKNLPTVIHHRWTYTKRDNHGAEKPVELCSQLLKWLAPSGQATVLDPFAGSGTVGVAAIGLGLDYCGIEMNEDDYKTAARRLGVARPGDGCSQSSLDLEP
jgi:site-specific DNA-methyltransferase (adenine-specific)